MTFSVQLHPPINGERFFTAEVLLNGERVHRDKLDPDSEFHRGKFLDALGQRVTLDDGTRRNLNSQLMFASPIGEKAKGASLMTRSYDQIQEEKINWAWEQRFALGKLSLIAGVAGVGKTFLETDLAARFSMGATFPDGAKGTSCEVLIVTCEDGAGDTIKPRLKAHGADMPGVHHLDGLEDGAFFTFPSCLNALDAWLDAHSGVGVIFFDPLPAFMDEQFDSHKSAEVRQALGPLCLLAERRGIAIIGISHLSKADTKAINRIIGSVAWVAAARSAWLVDWCPEVEGRRLFVQIKNNLGHADGLAYTIVDGRIVWEADAITTTADDLGGDQHGTPSDEARNWLEQVLADGPVASKDILKQAKADGIAERTLNRAKKGLRVRSKSMGKQWYWSLPEPTTATREPGFDDWNEGGEDCQP